MWEAFKYMMKLSKLRKLEKSLQQQTAIRAKSKADSIIIQKKYEAVKAELVEMKKV